VTVKAAPVQLTPELVVVGVTVYTAVASAVVVLVSIPVSALPLPDIPPVMPDAIDGADH